MKIKFIILLQILFCSMSIVFAEQITKADAEVQKALLISLIKDDAFNPAGVSKFGATIVLHIRTPEKTSVLKDRQLNAEIGEHEILPEILLNLKKRNLQGGSFYATEANYSQKLFPKNSIIVQDLSGKRRTGLSSPFKKLFPRSCAWVEMYLPAYNAKKNKALLIGFYGPAERGAVFTAMLSKKGNNWVLDWLEL